MPAPAPTPGPTSVVPPAVETARPGGIVRVAVGALGAPLSSGPLRYLDGVREVAAGDVPPSGLLLLGNADLAVAYGGSARRLAESAPETIRLLRAPGWDRTYFLWCDPATRWTADPNFRRWLGSAIDRGAMVEHLFGGRASAAWDLAASRADAPWPPAERRAFASTSSPVLRLDYDPADPEAASIASRLKAALEAERVELRLQPGPHPDGADLTLHRFERRAPDFGTDLRRVLDELDPAPRGAHTYLEQGTPALAEQALLIEAQAIPLVRVEAWFGADRRVLGLAPGWVGDLGLEQAWWNR